ncbi:restriction endonuclease subunit S [Vibrio cyclitrophicus]
MARELNSSEIPDGWSYGLLDKYAERCSGHTPSKSFPEYWDGGIKWISLADSFRLDKGLVKETDKEISKLGTENSSAQVHPAGTVVLSRDAGIGKSGVMAEPMAVSQHFIAWKCDFNNKIHNWFLYNWLQINKHEFERQAVGSTIKTIGLPYFKKLKIALPPYEEQRKIAKILSTWDKAIATTEKLIETSKQQKKALMQQLLTGKKRLTNPETGKAFEEEWEEVTFDDALSKLTDYTANGSFASLAENVKVYDEPNYSLWIMGRTLKSGKYDEKIRYTDKKGYEFLKKTMLFGGELLMPKTGDVGKAYLFPYLNQKATLADNVFLLDFKKIINNKFARYFINAEHFQFQLERTMYGTSQKTIVKKSLRKMKLLVPSLPEQEKITKVLDLAVNDIEVFEAKLTHLKQEKKALMQQLLTGKRRVKVDEMEVA